MTRTECGVCGSTDLIQILDLGWQPVPNRYPDPGLSWPLKLVWCRRCRLAQTATVAPDGVLYGADYAFRTGSSSAPHMRSLAGWISRRWPEAFVVEVGCNDGTLLKALAARGHPVAGVDPSTPADLDDLLIYRQPLTEAVAAEIIEREPAAVVVATNVLAHVVDAHEIIGSIATLLAPDGVLVAEVQYWPDLITAGAYDCCYHEHRYHWTLTGLQKLFDAHGLRLTGVEQIATHGGSVRITASRDGQADSEVMAMIAAERQWWAGRPPEIQSLADRIRSRLRDLVGAHKPIDALGASAKLVTLVAWCGLEDAILQVLDQTPAKQGHRLPGTAIPVVDPSEALVTSPRTLLLGAWSYLPQILRGDRGYFDGPKFTATGGHFVVPLPVPTLI